MIAARLDPFALTAADALRLASAAGGPAMLRERAASYGDAGRVAALAFEIAAEIQRPVVERDPLGNPAAVASYLALRHSTLDQEVMGALYLDTRNRLISDRVLFRGALNRAVAEPRQILREGLLAGACGVVVWHTHPSGDPSPSAEDLAFTRRLAEAGEAVGIRLVDHLVLGSQGRFVSLRERGW